MIEALKRLCRNIKMDYGIHFEWNVSSEKGIVITTCDNVCGLWLVTLEEMIECYGFKLNTWNLVDCKFSIAMKVITT